MMHIKNGLVHFFLGNSLIIKYNFSLADPQLRVS